MKWKKKPHGCFELCRGDEVLGWIRTAVLLPSGAKVFVWVAEGGEKEGWNFHLTNAKDDVEHFAA